MDVGSASLLAFGSDLTSIDMAMSQALSLVADLKLGWYTSIPPREMFACQILGTIIGALANCESLFGNVTLVDD
jgi:hypothetical protein